MKYQLFTYQGESGARPGIVVDGQHYDLLKADPSISWRSLDDVLDDWVEAEQKLGALAKRLYKNEVVAANLGSSVPFLVPVTRCRTIYGAGANYRDHVEAMAKVLNMNLETDPKAAGVPPWHFLKAGQATLAAHQQQVPMPLNTSKLDWEAELAVIIGREAYQVSEEQALDYVAGYSCANDLSARDHLKRKNVDPASPFSFDWIGQKCFTGSCPLGPYITPAEFIASPENLGIKLWLNGELKQDSNTSNHLYTVAEQISYLSQRIHLLPGDILLTGTPAGVGMESGVFLKQGDSMTVWIDGLGELENTIS